jgi:hypothetical protein
VQDDVPSPVKDNVPLIENEPDNSNGLSRTTLITIWSFIGMFAFGAVLFVGWDLYSSHMVQVREEMEIAEANRREEETKRREEEAKRREEETKRREEEAKRREEETKKSEETEIVEDTPAPPNQEDDELAKLISDPNRKPIFRGVAWGDRSEVVMELMPKAELRDWEENPPLSIASFESTINNMPCRISYQFFENKLYYISVNRNAWSGHIDPKYWSLEAEKEFGLYTSIRRTLEQKYGKGESDNSVEMKDVTFDLNDYIIRHTFFVFEERSNHVRNGLDLSYKWKSPISEMASAASKERTNKKLEKNLEKKKSEL